MEWLSALNSHRTTTCIHICNSPPCMQYRQLLLPSKEQVVAMKEDFITQVRRMPLQRVHPSQLSLAHASL